MANAEPKAEKNILVNKKARAEYQIEESFEAGLVLVGSEVKAIREGRLHFRDSYVQILHGEAYLVGAHVQHYVYAHQFNHDPERKRKLLLHKAEILKLAGKTREKGLTLIPLRLYLKNGRVKIELGLARGKKTHDRREDLKARDAAREIAQAMKARR